MSVEPLAIPPAWDQFNDCEQCGALKGKPCYVLRKLVAGEVWPVFAPQPHRGRPRVFLVRMIHS